MMMLSSPVLRLNAIIGLPLAVAGIAAVVAFSRSQTRDDDYLNELHRRVSEIPISSSEAGETWRDWHVLTSSQPVWRQAGLFSVISVFFLSALLYGLLTVTILQSTYPPSTLAILCAAVTLPVVFVCMVFLVSHRTYHTDQAFPQESRDRLSKLYAGV